MTTSRGMTKMAGMVMVITGLLGSLLAAPVVAAELTSEAVVGGWLGGLPCGFTAVSPSASEPTVVPFECVSGSWWDGTWVGQTFYRVEGTMDLVTGDLWATIDETLIGVVGASRAAGTLHLIGTVEVDGATSTAVVEERIVGGTGAFEGSQGSVVFEGFQASAVVGHGGYHGTWTHR